MSERQDQTEPTQADMLEALRTVIAAAQRHEQLLILLTGITQGLAVASAALAGALQGKVDLAAVRAIALQTIAAEDGPCAEHAVGIVNAVLGSATAPTVILPPGSILN